MKGKRKDRSPLSKELRRRRRENTQRQLRDGLLEVMLELTVYVVFLLVGIGVFALFGASAPEDAELIMLVGMIVLLVVGALVVGVIGFFKSRPNRQGDKKSTAADTERVLPKRRDLPSLQSLYDELAGHITGVTLEDFEIRVCYGSDVLGIKQKRNGTYLTLLNDELQSGTYDGEEAFSLAVAFAHDNRCDGEPVRIRDAWVRSIKGGVITYGDYLGRAHALALIDCQSPCGDGTVGAYDDEARTLTLYTKAQAIRIDFDAPFRARGSLLVGRRWKRYIRMKELIFASGYRLGEPDRESNANEG